MTCKHDIQLINLTNIVKTLSEELPNLKSTLSSLTETIKQQQDEIAALQSQLPTEVKLSANMSTDDPTPVPKHTQLPNADIPTTVASLLAEGKENDQT